MKFFEKAKKFFDFLLDCLFPRCCTICNRRVDGDDYCNLCSSCVEKIPWIRGNKCSLCSCPMGDTEMSGEEKPICAECKANPPYFKSGMSCWLHKGVGRDIILTIKYRNADFLKNDIATLLKRYCGEVCEFVENSLLVPVPTPYFRRIKRGYNQAEVIAYAVAKIVNNASVVNMLRSKNKKSQTKLKRDDRLLNIKGMIECSTDSENILPDSRIVIVDDVSTTGTTVNECCRILQGAGFSNLHVLTLSYG
ncbi:MAG: hypothetical protein LBD34_00060 [Puniceicoccales bacterium]|nr:hypothetical protein [Puniceicoccales bacterium]